MLFISISTELLSYSLTIELYKRETNMPNIFLLSIFFSILSLQFIILWWCIFSFFHSLPLNYLHIGNNMNNTNIIVIVSQVHMQSTRNLPIFLLILSLPQYFMRQFFFYRRPIFFFLFIVFDITTIRTIFDITWESIFSVFSPKCINEE